MKKLIKLISLTIVIALLFSSLSVIKVNAAIIDFVVSYGVLTKYTGADTVVVIPDNLGITKIGNWAFYQLNNITSIIIPEGVNFIDDSAFIYCSALKSISIPESVVAISPLLLYGTNNLCEINVDSTNINYSSSEGVLFNKNKTILYKYPCGNANTMYTIPDSVKVISESAFNSCKILTRIIIPDSVTSIGNGAFEECDNLYSITIPESVSTIGIRGFFYCRSLSTVVIPNSIKSIGRESFLGTPWLSSSQSEFIIVGNGILIEYKGSSSEVVVPETVEAVGDGAFYDCTGITSVVIPASVISIGAEAFSGCTSLTSVVIPDSVISVGGQAFYETKISEPVFVNNAQVLCFLPTSFANYVIPDTVKAITAGAFMNCISLTTLSIPESVKEIGEWAFYNCIKLIDISIPYGVTTIGKYVFSNCNSLSSISIPTSVLFIGERAFRECRSLKSVIIPDSVTLIDKDAFSYCTSLTSIIIPRGVRSIGIDSFGGCSSLISVVIKNGVEYIGDSSFSYCKKLTSMTIPNSVTYIGYYAFIGCTSMLIHGLDGSYIQQYSNIYGLSFEINSGFIVTYINYDGIKIISQKILSGDSIIALSIPIRFGYIFGGWYKELTCINLWDFTTDTVSTDISIYEQWIMKGDVNDSKSVTSSDALLVLQVAAGKRVFSNNEKFAADVINDGNITASDALRILQFSAGKISSFE